MVRDRSIRDWKRARKVSETDRGEKRKTLERDEQMKVLTIVGDLAKVVQAAENPTFQDGKVSTQG